MFLTRVPKAITLHAGQPRTSFPLSRALRSIGTYNLSASGGLEPIVYKTDVDKFILSAVTKGSLVAGTALR